MWELLYLLWRSRRKLPLIKRLLLDQVSSCPLNSLRRPFGAQRWETLWLRPHDQQVAEPSASAVLSRTSHCSPCFTCCFPDSSSGSIRTPPSAPRPGEEKLYDEVWILRGRVFWHIKQWRASQPLGWLAWRDLQNLRFLSHKAKDSDLAGLGEWPELDTDQM